MSGTTEDDPSTYVLWWFAPRGMDRGSCDVAMYVPMADRPDDASGHPTAYLVLRGREQPVVVGSFLVDQTVNRGRWVAVGRYTLADGEIVIKMLNRGSGGNRHAAAQAWIECTRQ
jgi:hypothetical protein